MVNHRDRLAEINASAAPSLTVAGVRSRNRSGERDDRVVFRTARGSAMFPFKKPVLNTTRPRLYSFGSIVTYRNDLPDLIAATA